MEQRAPTGNSLQERAQRLVNMANRRIGSAVFSVVPNSRIGIVMIKDNKTGRQMSVGGFEKNMEAYISKYLSGKTKVGTGMKPSGTIGGMHHSAFIQSMLDYYGDVDMHKIRDQARKGR